MLIISPTESTELGLYIGTLTLENESGQTLEIEALQIMVLEKSKPDDEINIDENEQQTGSEAEAVEVVIRIEEILTREEV